MDEKRSKTIDKIFDQSLQLEKLIQQIQEMSSRAMYEHEILYPFLITMFSDIQKMFKASEGFVNHTKILKNESPFFGRLEKLSPMKRSLYFTSLSKIGTSEEDVHHKRELILSFLEWCSDDASVSDVMLNIHGSVSHVGKECDLHIK